MPLLRQIRFRALFAALPRLGALTLLLAGLTAAPGPALAQGGIVDFFGSIFGERHAPPPGATRARPARRPKPHPAPAGPASYSAPATARGSPAQAAAPAATRPPPSFFVAVIGDSEAGLLAQGLTEAFANDPRVAIINKSREDSGLVRDDFYDWRLAAKNLLEGPQHIDMAVIQIGINDNQKLRGGDNAFEPLSKPFNEIYAKRVEEIADAFRDKNVPLVWVGLPIMRSESLSIAAMVFNDLDRQYGGAAGARFVDLWEPFTDLGSSYKASGPDVNGAIVRLRAADGVHFNKAGARKAAHFVEPEIRHVLEASLKPEPAPAPAEPAPSATPAPGAAPAAEAPEPAQPVAPPPKPLAGKIQPLTDPAVSPGGSLAGIAAPNPPPPDAAPAQPGRADDFSWPQK